MLPSQLLAQFPDLEPFLEPAVPTPSCIELAFCRAELGSPTCVIPNGHLIRVIGGAEAPIAVVSPGGSAVSRRRMIAYAHTFAAGPKMLQIIKQALVALDADTPLDIQPGSAIHRGLREAADAAQPHKSPKVPRS
jgi:hypothetical protein